MDNQNRNRFLTQDTTEQIKNQHNNFTMSTKKDDEIKIDIIKIDEISKIDKELNMTSKMANFLRNYVINKENQKRELEKIENAKEFSKKLPSVIERQLSLSEISIFQEKI